MFNWMLTTFPIIKVASIIGLSALITMIIAIKFCWEQVKDGRRAIAGAGLAALFCFFLVVWAIATILVNVL